jgi:hypothetical protein
MPNGPQRNAPRSKGRQPEDATLTQDEMEAELRILRQEQVKSRPRKFAQNDKWSFCLTAGTLVPANQERPCRDDRAGTTHRLSRRRWRLPP